MEQGPYDVADALSEWMAGRESTEAQRAGALEAALRRFRRTGSLAEALAEGQRVFLSWVHRD